MAKKEKIGATVAFGANVRRERTKKGLTQEALAEASDLNPRTIQKVEAGAINVLLLTAIRIRRSLDCPWDQLMPK